MNASKTTSTLLRAIAASVERFHPNADKIRPREIVDEIETTLTHELDLQREGANASLLRRNFLGSNDLYVPEVVWSHTNERVLTLERVRGIPVDDLAALDAAGIDRVAARRERRAPLLHAGVPRQLLSRRRACRQHLGRSARTRPTRVSSRSISASWERCRKSDQYWLAENFLALFNQDYRRVAELHIRAGWMPADARLDELEAAVRTVCEPYFTRPLAEISLAEVVVKLFQMARRYELTLQPQLILLQKTLLNIEGVGRLLHPQIDIWATAKPVLERIWRERHGPRAMLKALRRRVPEWLAAAPDMPQLVHDYLVQATRGKLELRIASNDLKAIEQRVRHGQRVAVLLALAGALLVSGMLAAVVSLSTPSSPGMRLLPVIAIGAGVIALIAALRKS